MWIDRLYEKYKHTTEDIHIPKVEWPIRDEKCDVERLKKILPKNYFNVEHYREEPVDNKFLRRNGIKFLLVSATLFSIAVYMLYHCHKASCNDCLINLHKFPCDSCVSVDKHSTPTTKILGSVIPHILLVYLQHSNSNTCGTALCIYNHIWNASTHYEKCYYSNLVVNTVVFFLVMRLVRWLAMLSFQHSVPAVSADD